MRPPSGRLVCVVGCARLAYRWMLYSVDSITTRGASGLMVLPHWQMLGALEAADGILLFGISTAYVFAVIRAYWPMLIRRY